MNNQQEEIIKELTECFWDVKDEYTLTREDYWQGKKDGLRIALMLLNPEGSWEQQLDSTPTGNKATLIERLQGRLKSARYSIGAILWEMKKLNKVDYRTKMNLINWISDYDFCLVPAGDVESLPDALDVYDK